MCDADHIAVQRFACAAEANVSYNFFMAALQIFIINPATATTTAVKANRDLIVVAPNSTGERELQTLANGSGATEKMQRATVVLEACDRPAQWFNKTNGMK